MANPHRYTYPSSSSAPPASTPPALNWQHMDTSVFPAAHLDTVSSVADAPSADRSLPSVCELFPHWPYPPNQATQIGGGPSPPLPLPPAAPPYGSRPTVLRPAAPNANNFPDVIERSRTRTTSAAERWTSTTASAGTSSTLFLPARGSPARSPRACLACRRRKVKCLAGDKEGSACERCARTGLECVWEPVGKKPSGGSTSASEAGSLKRAPGSKASDSEHGQEHRGRHVHKRPRLPPILPFLPREPATSNLGPSTPFSMHSPTTPALSANTNPSGADAFSPSDLTLPPLNWPYFVDPEGAVSPAPPLEYRAGGHDPLSPLNLGHSPNHHHHFSHSYESGRDFFGNGTSPRK